MDITGIGALADAASSIIGKFFPDKTQQEKDQLALQLQSMMDENGLVKAQIEVNKVEAGSTNWFVAGWRPFVGWMGGFAFGYAAILEPLMRFIAVQAGYHGAFPVIDTTITMQVLLGLLGLGGMRTYEKKTGTEGNR
ncbi:MAG TPA: 3TM-type holin [Dehalococcoidia bacterium]|nr:3TM-type holin [Dehalococcoidia bacterium]